MKKRVLCILLLCLLALTGCEPRSEWRLDLTGGYAVDFVNRSRIILIHLDDPAMPLTDSYLTAVRYNDRYIVYSAIPVPGDPENPDLSGLQLFLLDTRTGVTYDPFTDEQDLIDTLAVLDALDMCDWIVLNDFEKRPSGAYTPET